MCAESNENVFIDRFIGNSKKLLQFKGYLLKAAHSNLPVLLIGETGTGKELAAEFIHLNSQRFRKPYYALNIGAIPVGLVESELFGHEKGSFTTAINSKTGLLEAANGGTVFLDEIAEAKSSTQVKILRFLDGGVIHRVGSERFMKADVRLVCATNADLAKMVEAGNFSKSLYYRIRVIQLHIPPLRDRKGDAEILAKHFLSIAAKDQPIVLSDEAIKYINNHNWPGNVRQLKNVIEGAFALHNDNNEITKSDILSVMDATGAVGGVSERTDIQDETLSFKLKDAEKRKIVSVLEAFPNRDQAADLLEISKRALVHKIKIYKINAPKRGEMKPDPRPAKQAQVGKSSIADAAYQKDIAKAKEKAKRYRRIISEQKSQIACLRNVVPTDLIIKGHRLSNQLAIERLDFEALRHSANEQLGLYRETVEQLKKTNERISRSNRMLVNERDEALRSSESLKARNDALSSQLSIAYEQAAQGERMYAGLIAKLDDAERAAGLEWQSRFKAAEESFAEKLALKDGEMISMIRKLEYFQGQADKLNIKLIGVEAEYERVTGYNKSLEHILSTIGQVCSGFGTSSVEKVADAVQPPATPLSETEKDKQLSWALKENAKLRRLLGERRPPKKTLRELRGIDKDGSYIR